MDEYDFVHQYGRQLQEQANSAYFKIHPVAVYGNRPLFGRSMYTTTAVRMLNELYGIPKAEAKRVLAAGRDALARIKLLRVGVTERAGSNVLSTSVPTYLFQTDDVHRIAYELLCPQTVANPSMTVSECGTKARNPSSARPARPARPARAPKRGKAVEQQIGLFDAPADTVASCAATMADARWHTRPPPAAKVSRCATKLVSVRWDGPRRNPAMSHQAHERLEEAQFASLLDAMPIGKTTTVGKGCRVRKLSKGYVVVNGERLTMRQAARRLHRGV